MPCPWLKDNKCTSPRLEKPSAMVVDEKCFAGAEEYRRCKYFEGSDAGPKNLFSYEKKPLTGEKPHPLVSALYEPVLSDCPFYRLEDVGGYYAAYCHGLERWLGRHEVALCKRYWTTCPIRRITAETVGFAK